MPAESTWEDHFLAKYLEARHRRLSSAGFLERYVEDHTYPSFSASSGAASSSTSSTESPAEGELCSNLPFRLPVVKEEAGAHGRGRGSISEPGVPGSRSAGPVTVAAKATA
ncbi:hypothetical protein KC331_g10938 [Hortaea werneckii]|nr:hypothetical protein KC331_g10938 [Hortaea werneckii]KAI7705048.1 hypothetical protein KC353_g13112 [Hortaea werneckii]